MGKQVTRLPPAVVSQLRSSTILSNVTQIAEELVCNSLDAGATKIEIAVDGEACHMQVDDDGCGISRDNLTLVGERHATSKLHSLDELEGGVATLGFRGEALSSLSDVSLVEITSRCRGMPNTYRKILKGGATLSIGLSGEQRTYGTRVLVRDMFYNQPVRRRLLHSSHRKILQSVKECVLRYVLTHAQVSFTVRDLARNDIVMHTKTSATLTSTLCDAFGEETVSRLQEIDYAQGRLRLNGYLSKTCLSHPSKALQYLYINRRYVLRTALHKLINSYAGKSKEALGQVNYDVQGTEGDMASSRQLFPAFVLQMTCPYSDYDITFEPSKTLVEFKDWEPVVSFVRSILQEIWGDLSVGRKQGFSQAHGTISAVPLVKSSGNGNNHRHKNSKQISGSKDQYPPMAVRRALVLNGSHHPGDFNKSQRSKHTATATSVDMPEKPGTASESPILSDSLPCTTMTKLEVPFKISNREYLVTNDARSLQIDDDGDIDCSVEPQTSWRRKPSRQRMEVIHSPTIPESDWFPNRALLPELKEQTRLSQPSRVVITLSSDSGETSASYCEKNQHKSSSFSDDRFRSSSSPTNTCESPLERLVKKSRQNPARFVRFRGDDDVRYLSPDEDTRKLRNEEWWEPDDLKCRTPPWSPVNDLTGTPRILDTSDILQEVSSCSPERSSSGKHSSHQWKLPKFDSENIDSVIDWRSRIQSKRQRVDYVDGSDSDELAELFSSKSYSFDPSLEKKLDSSETMKSKQSSWKGDIEDRSVDMKNEFRCVSVTDFQETEDDRPFSLDMDERGDTHQDEDYDIEIDSCYARAKWSLDLDLDTSSENFKLPFDLSEKRKPGKQNKVHDSFASTLSYTRRGYSGPPFYKPPTRYGVHMNPLNSLSTVETLESKAEEAVVRPMEPDRRSKVSPAAHREATQKREMPHKKTELKEGATILSEEPSLDANGLSIQSRRPSDQWELENCGPKVNSEAECPLDAVNSTHEEVELHHRHCKYRSADVTTKTPDGAELPKDTVKAMLKEWSNPCMKKDDDILDLSSGILASDVQFLLPGSITKDVLKQARVLQQVDTKFIAAVSCGVLLLIDQHAADERVRLEELRRNVLDGNMTKKISLLSRPQQLTMTFAEQQTLQTYCQQIRDWGWRFKITSDNKPFTSQRNSTSSGGMCKVLLNAVPSILGVKLTGADLVEYLQQLTDTQGSSTPPPAVVRLLNNKACRGAIMFGDKLLPAECSQLVDHLKRTFLCFQCAHGRPTMIPLVDIQALDRRFGQSSRINMPDVNMDSNKGFDVTRRVNASWRRWHGLHLDVKPSLERAQARLAQAQGVQLAS